MDTTTLADSRNRETQDLPTVTLALDRLPILAELVTAALARARADSLLPAAVA
jgi:hypothetical protein